MEAESQQTRAWLNRWQEEQSEKRQQQLQHDRCHLLLLSIVATRLRAEYESVEDARLVWLLESQMLLRRLDNPSMEAAILEPTMKVISVAAMRSVARDYHVLMELIMEYV